LEITKYATTDANVNDMQGDILAQEIAYSLQYIKRTDILFCAFAVLLVSLFVFFQGLKSETKSEAVVTVVWLAAEAMTDSAVPGVVAPVAPAEDPVGARRRTLWVRLAATAVIVTYDFQDSKCLVIRIMR